MSEVTVILPSKLTSDLLHALRKDDLTACEDKDEMNKRIGWLICAYDVLIREYNKVNRHSV
jgi:hypothetical protein